MHSPDIEKAFDLFAQTDDPIQRKQALSTLVDRKALPKLANDARFELGISRWIALAGSLAAADVDRLLALAELARATNVVGKTIKDRVAEVIEAAFPDSLPPLRLLTDAKDRLYGARAVSVLRTSWLPYYLAQAIAEEDTGEKPRAELVDALLGRVDSVADAVSLLSRSFVAVRFETEAPGESMAKRLSRTLRVLRAALLTSPLEAGQGAGKLLDEWVRGAMSVAGTPKEEETRIELAREIALTLHDLVRTRFSVSTEPETFAALKYARAFFRTVSWPAELRGTMDLLVQDILEALLMLSRQDVPNQGLLDQLELACGLKERARAVATQLADRHSELKEPIRNWLRRGRFVVQSNSSDTLQESLLQAADASIGLALIESRKLKALDDTLERVVSTLEIYDPAAAAAVHSYGQQVNACAAAVAEVCKRRSVDLLGAEGEEIDFLPKYFEPLSPVTGRPVVVRRPAIVKRAPQQEVADVVLKGFVE